VDNKIIPDNELLKMSVILPIHNERDTIRNLIILIVQVLKEAEIHFEIIAVDDGSTDGSSEVLQGLHKELSDILCVITHPYNKGNGAAIKTGIRAARGEIVACMDGDGQHDPQDLIRMLPLTNQYDLVIGTRTQTYQGIWYRGFANKLYNILASWLAEFPIEDLTSGYRLFRTSVVRKYAEFFPARYSYPTTSTLVVLKGGYSVKFIPINVRPRQSGVSKINIITDGWRFIVIILKIIVFVEPLRVFLPVSVSSFFLAILSAAYATWVTQSLRIPNSSVVLFVLGVVVLLLGLVSEQLTAILISLRDDTKR